MEGFGQRSAGVLLTIPSATLALPSSSSVEPGGPREEQPIEPPPAPASTSTSSDEIEEQDQLYEWGTPAVSTPVTEVPLVSPTMDENDATIVPASLSTISPEATPTTPTPNHNLLRDSLFDAPSPLTPMNSPSLLSQEEEHPPIAFLEDTTPAPDQASLNTKGRKRKRTSSRRAMQNPRRRRKPRPEETWDATPNLIGFSEGSHTDPLIWPPVVEDGANSQKVGPTVFSLVRLVAHSVGNSMSSASDVQNGSISAVWDSKVTTRMDLLGCVPFVHCK